MGFEAVRAIPGLDPEILIVPLPGHSRGHSAVAVRDGDGWLLHCGDAYFFHGERSRRRRRCPPGLRFFQTVVGYDGKTRRANQERLRELAARPRRRGARSSARTTSPSCGRCRLRAEAR